MLHECCLRQPLFTPPLYTTIVCCIMVSTFYTSNAVASPPSGVSAVQDGLTSIRVTWTPPSPLGDTTSYRISYTGGGGSSGSVDVDGGNSNCHSLMGFTNGETYTITIVSKTSPGLPSTPVEAGTVSLCKSNCLHTTRSYKTCSYCMLCSLVCLCCIYSHSNY